MVEKNFKAIEGLRGYLALWVALGHAMQLAGYLDPPGPLKLIMQGGAAVEVFMIVSGFVISHLILVKGERYDVYIVRRFFRLYPCFLICCVIGFLSLPLWSSVVHQFHWSASGWPSYVAGVDALQRETTENFRAHAILHALMLHGAVPAEILPKAPMTFLPAAWSISLEWQFYLVAPAVLALTKGAGRLAALVLIVLGAHALYLKGVFGSFEVESHIAGSMGLFAVGIVSRLALESLRAIKLNSLSWALITFALSVILFKQFLAVAVWMPFYCYLVWGDGANRSERFFDLLFSNKAALLVGQLSFSVYLLHRPAQVIAAYAWNAFIAAPTQISILIVQLVATLAVIPASWLMYRYVEKPGMNVGRSIASRLGGRKFAIT